MEIDLPHDPERRTAIELSGVKSSLRMTYEAEVRLIRSQHGGLEEVRLKLGLSRRKMCQLLMVDPSAWTRWTRDESKVPPSIFRALEWFLALNAKALTHPELANVFNARYRQHQGGHSEEVRDLQNRLEELTAGLARQHRISNILVGVTALLGAVLLAFIFRLGLA